MTEARVYVISDDEAARRSLALLLEPRGLRPEAYSAAQFLGACRPDWAGCIVLERKSLGMDGLQLQAALAQRDIALPVIFIEWPIDDALLLVTVRSALARGADQRPRGRESAAERMKRLTAREREVLRQVTEGKNNREIAAELGISPRTVEVYKSRMMEKLQVRRLSDLLDLVRGGRPSGALDSDQRARGAGQ